MKIPEIVILISALLLSSLWAESKPTQPKKPNIIFVMTDDQGYPVVGAHGHPWIRTPHMDAMYEKSIRFDRFMMGSTCAPSRAGIMTGNHAIRNGVTHTIHERERVNLKAIMLPQVLKKAGYTSGCFGKWHLGDEAPYQPESRGFDEVFIHGAGGIGQKYNGSCADVPGNKYFDTVFKENGTFVKTKGYCTDNIFKATLGWIKKKKDEDAPFFAYLATNAPHAPFIAPPEFEKYYQDRGFSKKTAGFYGMIDNIDVNLGIMFDKLEEWDLLKNTIIIFTSDNGMTGNGSGLKSRGEKRQVKLGTSKEGKEMYAYNAQMKGLKGAVDEGGVRVPFFVRWDGMVKKGRTVDTVVSYLDILPTFAEIAGLKLPSGHEFPGKSMLPFFTEESPEWEDRFHFQHKARWPQGANPDKSKWKKYAVRNQRFRLVEGVLYDMVNDPGQTKDVTAEHSALVAEMKKHYEIFWDTSRPLMINEDAPKGAKKPFHVDYFAQEKAKGIPMWEEPEL